MQAVGRQRTIRGYHMDMMADLTFTSDDMPVMEPCDVVPDDLLSFNYVTGHKASTDQGVHFFIDDYQFERVWRDPIMYAHMLERYQCVLAPDFSLYTDMPLPLQRWNCYRSRFVGAYWQQLGLNVIPTLQWGTPASYAFSFDGIPEEATLATSTIGVRGDEDAMEAWRLGMYEAINRLAPKLILLYGGEPTGFDWGNTPHITYRNHNIRRLKWVDAEHRHHAEDRRTEEVRAAEAART